MKRTTPQRFEKIKRLQEWYTDYRRTFFYKRAEVPPYNPDWETFAEMENSQSYWVYRKTFIKWGYDEVRAGRHSVDFLYRHVWMKVCRKVVNRGGSRITHYEVSHRTPPVKGISNDFTIRLYDSSSISFSPFSKEKFHESCEKLYQKVKYNRLQEEKDLNKLLNSIKKDYQLSSTLFKFLRDQAYLATFCLRYDGKFYRNPKPFEVMTPYGAQEYLLSSGYSPKTVEAFIPVYSQIITNCSLTPVKIDLKSLRRAVEDRYTYI